MRIRLLPLAPLLLAAGALAGEPDTGSGMALALSAGVSHSDNAGRTATGGESETSLEAGISGDLQYERKWSSAQLAADLRYLSHDYGDYDEQLTGGLSGQVSVRIARQITWSIEDNFGQSLIDARDTVTPANTQNTNVFSTGPDVELPIGARTSIVLQGRWTDTSYQESDFGSRSLTGTLGMQRQLGRRTAVSLNASTQHVENKGLAQGGDYDIHSAYLAWEGTGALTTLGLRAGANRLKEETQSSSAALLGVDLTRRLSPRSVLEFDLGRTFGSSADLMRRDQGIGGVTADGRPAVASSDPLRADHISLSWALQGDRSSLELSTDWRRERHRREIELNRKSNGGGMRVTRQLRPRLDVHFSANYLRQDFDASALEAEEWSTMLGTSWRLTRGVGISADWTHAVGDGDTSAGTGLREYTENRYSLRLTWSPAG